MKFADCLHLKFCQIFPEVLDTFCGSFQTTLLRGDLFLLVSTSFIQHLSVAFPELNAWEIQKQGRFNAYGSTINPWEPTDKCFSFFPQLETSPTHFLRLLRRSQNRAAAFQSSNPLKHTSFYWLFSAFFNLLSHPRSLGSLPKQSICSTGFVLTLFSL